MTAEENQISDTNNHFDVIIIGAGPGGLNCAKYLEESNLKVLLIEKNDKIGPKVCAGGITTKDMALFDFPKELIDYSYNEIIVETPTIRQQVKSDRPFVCTIDRQKFGSWQASQLKKTTITTGKRVSKIESDHIELENNEKLYYKFLVGADGSNSVVRKFLKLKSDHLAFGIQYIVPKELYSGEDLLLRFSNREFYNTYGWIFPHREFTSIGTGGITGKTNPRKLRQNLDKWMQSLNISVEKCRYESFPINCSASEYDFGNIFLCGDAAGLVSAFTFEGIYSALVSGKEVACKIIDSKYEMKHLEQLTKTLKQHRTFANFLERLGPLRQIFYNSAVKKLSRKEKIEEMIENYI